LARIRGLITSKEREGKKVNGEEEGAGGEGRARPRP